LHLLREERAGGGVSKYGNVPTIVDGQRFDSKAEAARYRELTLLLKAGDISDLRIHPIYKLEANGVLICRYVSDFEYVTRDGRVVVEDVKGKKTDVYLLKRKLMRALRGIEITEVAA
jgi:hypothetical protein